MVLVAIRKYGPASARLRSRSAVCRCSTPVTVFSFCRAEFSWARLSETSPASCCPSRSVPVSSVFMHARVLWRAAERVEHQELPPQQGLDLDLGRGLVADPRVAHPEADPYVVDGELDLGHLADLDPGDPHLVVRLQPGGLAELRLENR